VRVVVCLWVLGYVSERETGGLDDDVLPLLRPHACSDCVCMRAVHAHVCECECERGYVRVRCVSVCGCVRVSVNGDVYMCGDVYM